MPHFPNFNIFLEGTFLPFPLLWICLWSHVAFDAMGWGGRLGSQAVQFVTLTGKIFTLIDLQKISNTQLRVFKKCGCNDLWINSFLKILAHYIFIMELKPCKSKKWNFKTDTKNFFKCEGWVLVEIFVGKLKD